MTALLTLAAGAALALACWWWAVRRLDGSSRMAIVVALGVAASAFNIVVPIPNVEATTTMVLCTALLLGAPSGAAVGLVAVIATSVTGGVGMWSVWQIVGMAVVALAGGLLGYVAGHRADWFDLRSGLLLQGAAAIATCCYDVIVTVPTVLILSPMPPSGTTAATTPLEQAIAALLLGVPFTLVHVVFVMAFTAIAGPPLLFTLGRARLRLVG